MIAERLSGAQSPDHLHAPFAVWLDPGMPPKEKREIVLESLKVVNPYDPTRTCGGSSGGAAVALACGMVPIADGSDMGGSLRNPASFCNVVGFRPSSGRVPSWPDPAPWHSLTVDGPMARTVEDAALMLSAIAGPDPRCPISISEPADLFLRSLERDFGGVRVALSRDLGGLPVDHKVKAVLESQRRVFRVGGTPISVRSVG